MIPNKILINANIKIDENLNLISESPNTDLSVSSILYHLYHKFPKDESPSQYHYLLLKKLAISEHLISNPELKSYKTKQISSFLEDEEIEPEVRPKKRSSDNNSSGGVESSEKTTSRISRSSKPKKITQKPTKQKTDILRNIPC